MSYDFHFYDSLAREHSIKIKQAIQEVSNRKLTINLINIDSACRDLFGTTFPTIEVEDILRSLDYAK